MKLGVIFLQVLQVRRKHHMKEVRGREAWGDLPAGTSNMPGTPPKRGQRSCFQCSDLAGNVHVDGDDGSRGFVDVFTHDVFNGGVVALHRFVIHHVRLELLFHHATQQLVLVLCETTTTQRDVTATVQNINVRVNDSRRQLPQPV